MQTRRILLIAIVAVSLAGCRWSVLFLNGLTEEENHAVSLSEVQLHRLWQIPEFADVQPDYSQITPIRALGSADPVMYEIKLVRGGAKQDSGYILANFDRRDFPVPGFATAGPTISEMMTARVGHDNYDLVRITPSFYVAYDRRGNPLATLGSIGAVDDEGVEDSCRYDDDLASIGSAAELYAFVASTMDDVYADIADDVAAAWAAVDTLAVATSRGYTDNIVYDPGQDLYSPGTVYAEGSDTLFAIGQIPADTGANDESYLSGCGAAAWTVFLAWHDRYWTPDLLRGSEDFNNASSDDGRVLYGTYESQFIDDGYYDLYIDRVQMDLSRALDTWHGAGGQGATFLSDFSNGYDYITNTLGTTYTGRDYQWRRSSRVGEVYDHLCADQRPLLMYLPWHYTVIAGLLYNQDSDAAGDQWLYLNTGWGWMGYLQASYMRRYWYLKDIAPRTRYTYPVAGTQAPAVVTLRNADAEAALLRIYARSDVDGKIYGYQSTVNSGATVANVVPPIGVTGTVLSVGGTQIQCLYPPAATVDAFNRTILACVDSSHHIHLYRDEGSKGWVELEFPQTVTTDVRPAISGGQADWFTIAFSNSQGVQLMGSNNDLQRSGAWPTTMQTSVTGGYFWYRIDLNRTVQPIHMTRWAGNTTIVCWNDGYSEYDTKINFHVCSLDGQSPTSVNVTDARYGYAGAPDLVASNDTLFLCYESANGRINVDAVIDIADDARDSFYYTHPSLIARLTDRTNSAPSLGAVVLEHGQHPMLVPVWFGEDAAMRVSLCSVDWIEAPLDYSGVPVP